MIEKRCPFCGRVLDQHGQHGTAFYHPGECARCNNGEWELRIAHAKAVRLAWKKRKLSKKLEWERDFYLSALEGLRQSLNLYPEITQTDKERFKEFLDTTIDTFKE